MSECQSRGVTVVEFREISIVHDIAMGDITRELTGLVAAGHTCTVLNFGNILHMSSQLLGIVLKAHKQCRAAGGTLKVCKVRPEVAEIFAITNVERVLEIYPDEWAALESDWPEPSPQRIPLPLETVSEDRVEVTCPGGGAGDGPGRSTPDAASGRAAPEVPTAPDLPLFDLSDFIIEPSDTPPESPEPRPPPRQSGPFQGDAPARAGASPAPQPDARGPAAGTTGRPSWPPAGASSASGTTGGPAHAAGQPIWPAGALRRVRLRVLVGRDKGKAVEVHVPRFFIGRDLSCHLRAHSPIVSRFHALIEQRGGQVFLRDLGSSNGTRLGDRMLQRDEEVEVADGKQLQIGPMQFTFAIEPASAPIAASAPTSLPAPEPSLYGMRPTSKEFLEGEAPSEPSAGRGSDGASPSKEPPSSASEPLPAFHHTHPQSFILCPKCGTEGWVPMERLLREFVRVLEQSWPRPPAPAASHNGTGPRVSNAQPPMAASARAYTDQPTVLDLRALEPPDSRHNGATPVARAMPVPHDSAPAKALQDGPAQRVVGAQPPPARPDLEDFEIPMLEDLLTSELPDAPTEGGTADVPVDRDSAGQPRPKRPAAPPSPRLQTLAQSRTQPARSTGDQLDLELLCPKCREKISAPVSQLGRQLSCKACDSKLFLHSNGELIAGDPPPMPRVSTSSPWSQVWYTREKADALGRFLERWQRVPRAAQIAAVAACFVLFLGLMNWALTGPELPSTLTERVVFVGEAFARNDEGRLRAIASPDSERDVVRWFRLVRPNFWRGKIRDVRVKAAIFYQNTKAGKAATLAKVAVTDIPGGFSTPTATPISPRPATGNLPAPAAKGPSPPTAKGLAPPAVKVGAPAPAAGRAPGRTTAPAAVKDSREITLRLFWALDQEGQWRLDGRQTLDVASNSYR